MYKIKERPEDFIVKEISDVELKDRGEYTYFLLKKRNYNTLDAIERIARAINVGVSRLGFAGNKDKMAITEQLVSVSGVKKENLEKLRLKDIEIKVCGYSDEYNFLGNLQGNEFVIIVRELGGGEIKKFEEKIENEVLMPNYFGEQRFSEQNVDIGRAIIKRNFEEASKLLNLDIVDNDYIGAMRKINKKILRLYVHSYQSYIFNETIKEYLKLGTKENEKIPIVGFGTELEKYNAEIRRIIEGILSIENLDLRDFITLKMPELSEEGIERDLFVEIRDLEVLEKGGNWVKVKFFLKKGSYATEAIDFLFDDS